MGPAIRGLCAFFLVFAMFVSLGQVFVGRSETVSILDRAEAYVKSVLPFDMASYAVVGGRDSSLPSGPGDPTRWDSVSFDLQGQGSSLHVVLMQMNDVMYQCGVSVMSGSVVPVRQFANLSEAAAYVLERHGEAMGVSSADLIGLLGLVDETVNCNATLGGLSLTVRHMSIPTQMNLVGGHFVPATSDRVNQTDFCWSFSYGGAYYNHVGVSFSDGVFCGLQDDRAIHPVGGTKVKVSREQAINTALAYVGRHSFTLSNGTELLAFNVSEARSEALLFGYPRNYSSLFACWSVTLNFNGMQFGNEVMLKVWADTGEAFEPYLGGNRLIPDDGNPDLQTILVEQSSRTPTSTASLNAETTSSPENVESLSSPAPASSVNNQIPLPTEVPDASFQQSMVEPASGSGDLWFNLILASALIVAAICMFVGAFVFLKGRGRGKAAVTLA